MPGQGPVEMPFLDHLEELRWRLLWSVGALMLGIVVAFVIVFRYEVIAILAGPISEFLPGGRLVYTHPMDPFSIAMKASFAIGTILALPVILYQLWRFLAPALYEHEKRLAIPIVVGAALLFLGGVSLAYFVVLPLTLRFLATFQSASLQPMITARDYFGFAISMSLTFGVVFELPIAVLALSALGIVNSRMLGRWRRHAVIFCIVGAAFVTPGSDVISLVALAIPVYFLYELSILLARMVERRRARRMTAEAAAA